MTTLRRALLFSFVESYLGIALNLVSFVVLARLLTPEQVGLFSVGLALIGITQVIRDFGLVSFLIQKKELTDTHIATAWGLALLLGGGLFTAIELGAPLIGMFYDNDNLTAIARVVACNFLILPFNSICLALLRRDMNFKTVMRINLSSAVVSTLATLLLAWTGTGAFALAIGSVINSLAVACGLVAVGAASRLLRPALTVWRELVSFGGPVTFASVITSIAMDINDLAIGKMMGFGPVAMVSRAQGLMNLFHRDVMAAIRNVAYPAFSKAVRESQDVNANFVKSVVNVTVIGWTFYGFAGLFPLEVLRLMFGPQWDAAAPLVPLFCAAGAASAVTALVPTVMLADGHSKFVAGAELTFQPIKAMVLCMLIFWFRDLWMFALGFLGVAIFGIPFWFAIKQRCMPTHFGALARGLTRNGVLTAVTLAPALAIVTFMRPAHGALPYPIFFTCAALTCIAWIVSLWAFKHPLYHEFASVLAARVSPKRKTT